MVVESDKVKFSGLGKLTLRSPRPEDAGIYQCVAANKMGLSSHSTFVFLGEKSEWFLCFESFSCRLLSHQNVLTVIYIGAHHQNDSVAGD